MRRRWPCALSVTLLVALLAAYVLSLTHSFTKTTPDWHLEFGAGRLHVSYRLSTSSYPNGQWGRIRSLGFVGPVVPVDFSPKPASFDTEYERTSKQQQTSIPTAHSVTIRFWLPSLALTLTTAFLLSARIRLKSDRPPRLPFRLFWLTPAILFTMLAVRWTWGNEIGLGRDSYIAFRGGLLEFGGSPAPLQNLNPWNRFVPLLTIPNEHQRRALRIPVWHFAILTTAWAGWAIGATRRRSPGSCPRCGYSRSGIAPTSACPECGDQNSLRPEPAKRVTCTSPG
jgi:hypothetical protein